MPTIESARPWYPKHDPVHGFDHILRVYHLAEVLASEEGADLEIVRAAALLHDIPEGGFSTDSDARESRDDHQHFSSKRASRILEEEGWSPERIAAVQHCIRAHRFRDESEPPRTLEAKVLFDADKLDAIGAVGVVRAIAFAVREGQVLLVEPSERFLESGAKESDEPHSPYHEYHIKLRHIKERLYTPAARALARDRHRLLGEFFEQLIEEIRKEDVIK